MGNNKPIKYFHILLLLFLVGLLASCQSRGDRQSTLGPTELAVQQTKVIYQQQTRQAAIELTRCSQGGNCDSLITQSPATPVEAVTEVIGITPGTSPSSTFTLPATMAVTTLTLPVTTPGIVPSATRTLQSGSPTATPLTSTAASYPVATNPLTSPTATATRTATRTSTATWTPTATQTSTPQTGWAGEWEVYLEQQDGSYLSSTITISVDGTQLNASATIGGIAYTYSGTIYNDGQIATGSWETTSADGWFWWTASAADQFSGSNETRLGFCGARPGLPRPQPCRELPTS